MASAGAVNGNGNGNGMVLKWMLGIAGGVAVAAVIGGWTALAGVQQEQAAAKVERTATREEVTVMRREWREDLGAIRTAQAKANEQLSEIKALLRAGRHR